MIIEFHITGDPWHDWGLCELYAALAEIQPGHAVRVSPASHAGYAVETDATPEEFGKIIGGVLTRTDRWNALYPRFEEGKRIARCKPRTDGNGRRIPDEKYEPKVGNDEWAASQCRGKPPKTVRNRCQRLASIPLTQGQLRTLMNATGGPGSFDSIAANAARQGGRADITQGANPLVAKHHSNARVRGPSQANTALDAPSKLLLPNLCATVGRWKPFARSGDSECVLYLPVDLSFDRAWRLWKHLSTGALIDPDSPTGDMYRNLPLNGDGDEARLLILLDALENKLITYQKDGLFGSEIAQLNNWMAIHFSSTTNVNVGAVRRIEVPGDTFAMLAPTGRPKYWSEGPDVRFVPDCLVGLRIEDISIQNMIASALLIMAVNPLQSCTNLKSVAHCLYKNSERALMTTKSAAQLLPHFYRSFFLDFARRTQTMTEDQLDSCRKVGELAGSAFHRDVTILSRLHNTSSAGDLRENLELIAFRLFKASNSDEKTGLWHISGDEFKSLIDLATPDSWQAVALTISAFASLKAFNRNLGEGSK